MIAIVDYGVGNLFSLNSSLKMIGAESIVTADPVVLRSADKILLPGVGAFEDAANKLRASGLADLLKDLAAEGKPLLGICLGMQMLFEKSYEYGEHEGLGLIPGSVKPIRDVIPADYKIPHIGWNGLHFRKEQPKSPLFKDINEGDCVYFVHSYYASGCDASTIATCEYSAELTAAVQRGNVMGTQFHPEKSGDVGLQILKNFVQM